MYSQINALKGPSSFQPEYFCFVSLCVVKETSVCLEGLAGSPGDRVFARGFWPSAASAAAQMYSKFLPLGRSFVEVRRRFDVPASLKRVDENHRGMATAHLQTLWF